MRKQAGDAPFIDQGCVVTRLPDMLVELIRNTNGTAAAFEQTRNQVVGVRDKIVSLAEGLIQKQLNSGQSGGME